MSDLTCAQLVEQIGVHLANRLPEGVVLVEVLRLDGQTGARVTRLSDGRSFASRHDSNDPQIVEALLTKLSRAWVTP